MKALKDIFGFLLTIAGIILILGVLGYLLQIAVKIIGYLFIGAMYLGGFVISLGLGYIILKEVYHFVYNNTIGKGKRQKEEKLRKEQEAFKERLRLEQEAQKLLIQRQEEEKRKDQEKEVFQNKVISEEPNIMNQLKQIKKFFATNKYYSTNETNSFKEQNNLSNLDWLNKPELLEGLQEKFKVNIEELTKLSMGFDNKILGHNNDFIQTEKINRKTLFDSIEKYPLNVQQVDAILHDEDTTIIAAGAGCGKTSTIIGKATYLVKSRLAKPEEIAMISFTNKATENIEERFKDMGIKGISIQTFNSLANTIIGKVDGQKKHIGFDKDNTRESFLQTTLKGLSNSEELGRYFEFLFVYFPYEEKTEYDFKSLSEYYKYVKSCRLITLKGHFVKSFEELKIANYLYSNNIAYEYEPKYKYGGVDLKDPNYSSYYPDFYLTKYDIYLEHFGVNKQGNVAPHYKGKKGKSASQIYYEGMLWKRQVHIDYSPNPLIETFSWENTDKKLIKNLKQKLQNAGVNLTPIPQSDLFDKLNDIKQISYFIKLASTFLSLKKSNEITMEEIKQKMDHGDVRTLCFIKLFEELYKRYEAHLVEKDSIDFIDQIILATKYINEKRYQSPYKYILVDEFQDLSTCRYKFLKALIDNKSGSKLFGVGDDWQSIYRFTGSDVSLMTNAGSYFQNVLNKNIETTFRFNDKIAEVSSKFIQKNKNQSKRNIKTINTAKTHSAVFKILYSNHETDPNGANYQRDLKSRYKDLIEETLDEIITKTFEEQDSKPTVFLLGRYTHDKPKYLNSLKAKYSKISISFYTIHSSKGLTCDYAILLNVVTGKHGFPSELSDDSLLSLVQNTSQKYPNAEERRVFYVAITRARFKNYILTHHIHTSQFIDEIIKDFAIDEENIKKICDSCGGRMKVVEHNRKKFWSCSNYPLCEYTTQYTKEQNPQNIQL